MNINKITIISTIIVIILIISIPTIYKVVKNHNDNLFQVVEGKIVNAAKKCFYEEKCQGDTFYLKDLYELEYLDEVSNPITKEYYNVDSYVKRKERNFTFVAVE